MRHYWRWILNATTVLRDVGICVPELEAGLLSGQAPSKKFLSYYSGRLNAVEINYTFRRLPAAATLENWVRKLAPDSFSP